MKRISLTKNEKEVLRLLSGGCGCPASYPKHIYSDGVDSLERKGLAQGAWSEGHELIDAKITPAGKAYVSLNPSLRNPVDWKWLVTSAVALIGTASGIAALFIACIKS